MVERIKRYFKYDDERGSIEGLINFGEWREANLITSVAGTVRGNHYHKHTDEVFIILDGEIEVSLQRVESGRLVGEPEISVVGPGDVFVVRPMQYHIFTLKTRSRWINMLSQSIDSKDPDIYRLENY